MSTKPTPSERMIETHRQMDHAVTMEALERDALQSLVGRTEGLQYPSRALGELAAIVRAYGAILRKHREELDEIRERLEKK